MTRLAVDPHAGGRGAQRGKHLRRTLAVLGVGFALLLGAVTVKIAPFLFESNKYSLITSIERSASYRDPKLMQAAWHLPVALRYAHQAYEFQHNQSFCGPTSVADVLHSLGNAQSQEQMLEHSLYHSWFGYLLGGLTIDQLADLLHQRTGQPTAILRTLTIDQFRVEMRALNDPHRRYIANFHRGPLFGRGHGHFSPLLGYLAARDLVLVGDVNAAYRPFLVPTERLWGAVNTVDDATGKKRGLIVLAVSGK